MVSLCLLCTIMNTETIFAIYAVNSSALFLINFPSFEFQCQEKEHVEKIDHVEGIDQNSSRDPVEIVMQEVNTVCLVSAILNPLCCSACMVIIQKPHCCLLIFAYPSKLWLQIPGDVEKVDEDSSKNNIEKEIDQKVWVSFFFDQNFAM